MLTKEKIMRKLEQKKDQIRACGVKKLVLFGSFAKGTSRQSSDLDFLVTFAYKRGLYDDYVKLLNILRKTFNKDIDLVKESLVRPELQDSIFGGEKIEAKI
jgi:uncharacterized protein